MKRKGFTLVELLVALITGMFLLGTVYYAFGMGIRQWQKISQQIADLQVSTQVMEKISKDIRSSRGILPSSTDTQLQLNYERDIVSYDLANQKVRRKENSSTAYLTDVDEIKSLRFAYPSSKLIEIDLDNLKSKVWARN